LLGPPAQWTTFPAGHVELSERAAAKRARLGLKRGWPDILVLHGTLYGIELKRAGEPLSRTRAQFIADLPGFRRISTKQRYVLKEIADRVLGGDPT
jgi:hypothetical protein